MHRLLPKGIEDEGADLASADRRASAGPAATEEVAEVDLVLARASSEIAPELFTELSTDLTAKVATSAALGALGAVVVVVVAGGSVSTALMFEHS